FRKSWTRVGSVSNAIRVSSKRRTASESGRSRRETASRYARAHLGVDRVAHVAAIAAPSDRGRAKRRLFLVHQHIRDRLETRSAEPQRTGNQLGQGCRVGPAEWLSR